MCWTQAIFDKVERVFLGQIHNYLLTCEVKSQERKEINHMYIYMIHA